MKIAILNNLDQIGKSSVSWNLLNTAKERGHTVVNLNVSKLVLEISQKGCQIYFENEVIDPQDFDVLIPRFGRKMKYASKIVEHFSKNMGVYSTGSSEGIAISFDKMLTAQKLEQAGIRVPHTILVKKPKEVDFLLEKIGGLPCLMKIVTGGLGKGVQILETYSAAKSNMETIAYRFKSSILLQKLIVQDSKTITDMRLWVVGGKVIATTVRSHNDGDFQSDFAFSQTERNIKITAEERKMAIKVAKILKLDICGVDIMRDKDGVPYVLEVSANPSLSGITSESEVDISSKILDFIEKKVAKIKK